MTITYVADAANGNPGVYASRLTFIPPANDPTNYADATNFVVSDPIPVLQAGDSIPGLGTVQQVQLYDPINNTGFGQIAIWVQATGGTGIVRATSAGLSAVANSVTVRSGPPIAVGGISATFQPAQGSMTLAQAAEALGVDHFNWVQHITALPSSSSFQAYVGNNMGFTNPGFPNDAPEVAVNPMNGSIGHKWRSPTSERNASDLDSDHAPSAERLVGSDRASGPGYSSRDRSTRTSSSSRTEIRPTIITSTGTWMTTSWVITTRRVF